MSWIYFKVFYFQLILISFVNLMISEQFCDKEILNPCQKIKVLCSSLSGNVFLYRYTLSEFSSCLCFCHGDSVTNWAVVTSASILAYS